MRIEVSGKHLELTPAITDYAESKAAKLPRYYNGVQEIDIVLEGSSKGEQQFEAELRVDSEKHDTFVARASGQDIYEALDLSIDKMARQLTDFKEKLKNTKR